MKMDKKEMLSISSIYLSLLSDNFLWLKLKVRLNLLRSACDNMVPFLFYHSEQFFFVGKENVLFEALQCSQTKKF